MTQTYQRIKTTLLLFLLTACLVPANAQPQKAKQACFTLTTYRADGTVIATAPGVFISRDGTALAAWNPFKDAVKAEVKDAKGRKFTVGCLYGANALYNVARFRVDGVTDAQPLTPAATAAKTGTAVYVMAAQPQKTAVSRTEQFNTSYTYTVLESITAQTVKDNPDQYNGAAVVTDKGEFIGLYNYSSTVQSATDARYVDTFRSNALSSSDPTLRLTGVRIALPADEKDAQLALMLAGERNNDYHQAAARDYIAAFPTANDGYNALANSYVNAHQYDQADKAMQQAVSKAKDKAEAHYNYSRIISNYLDNIAPRDTTGTLYAAWTWDKAKTEADAASTANPLALYRQQSANTLLGLQKYQEAYDAYMALAKDGQLQGEPYYKAFLAKAALNASNDELLPLLNQAIAATDTAYASNYFYARALIYETQEKYREAMRDYIVYENLEFANLTGAFYYQREQCERKGKFFQTALQDIAHAVILSPRNADYWGEWASLSLQVGRYEDAEKAADGCLKLVPESPEALLIKGVAQCEQGQKTDGVKNITRAKELGNEQADSFLAKYK